MICLWIDLEAGHGAHVSGSRSGGGSSPGWVIPATQCIHSSFPNIAGNFNLVNRYICPGAARVTMVVTHGLKRLEKITQYSIVSQYFSILLYVAESDGRDSLCIGD